MIESPGHESSPAGAGFKFRVAGASAGRGTVGQGRSSVAQELGSVMIMILPVQAPDHAGSSGWTRAGHLDRVSESAPLSGKAAGCPAPAPWPPGRSRWRAAATASHVLLTHWHWHSKAAGPPARA